MEEGSIRGGCSGDIFIYFNENGLLDGLGVASRQWRKGRVFFALEGRPTETPRTGFLFFFLQISKERLAVDRKDHR